MPHSDNGKTEIISPIKISEKDKGVSPPGSGQQNLFKFLVLGLACFLIMVGGALLWIYLAKHPVDTAEMTDLSVTPQVKAKEESVETVDPIRAAAEKESAEQKLADFTVVKNELEGRGALEWGGIFMPK